MILSLILPCYQPPQGWERNIATAYNMFCLQIHQQPELIIVLDGTTDDITNQAATWLQQQIPLLLIVSYPENKGKGYAIRQGVAQATGTIVMYTDIDMPYTVESMLAIYNRLYKDECDVAIGVKDEQYYHHLPLVRKIISRCLRAMIRTFLAMPVTDTQCGLKGFRNNVKPLFLSTTINRYLFDLEFIRNCFAAKKYRVSPIPVALNGQVHFRKMNYRILFPEMLNFVRLLFKKPQQQ